MYKQITDLATVITSLMSAIPWVGQDIVEFIWGGFNQLLLEEPNSSDVVQQILLNARISPISVFGYDCVYIFVKKPKAWGQPAGVRHTSTVEASQRLNAENLNHAYILGLFEGDGYFTVTQKGKYFKCEVGIELSIRYVQLVYKIKNILGVGVGVGVGVVVFRKREKIKMVYLRVIKKDHLINTPFFPISNMITLG